MAANAQNWLQNWFATQTSNLATNTSLATATRLDFPAITLDVPETGSRNFQSVFLKFAFNDAFTTATEITAIRMGVGLGVAAIADTDITFTQANTADHFFDEWILNATAYFNANFGAGASQTCTASLAVATTAASAIGGNITCEIEMTYAYDDAVGTTRSRTIVCVVGSHAGLLSLVQQETGIDGTNPPASGQIPQLTSSGLIKEASPSIKSGALVIEYCNGSGSTVDDNPEIQIDAGSVALRGVCEQAQQTLVTRRDVINWDFATNLPTTSHVFKMRDTTTNGRGANVGGLFKVTYTYDKSATTRLLNLVCVPVRESNGANQTSWFGGLTTASADAQVYDAVVDIQEPGTITLERAGVAWHGQVIQSGGNFLLSAGGQTFRTYTPATSSSEFVVHHRCDYGSGWSLARGSNKLALRYYNGAGGSRSYAISGVAWILYSSDVPAAGPSVANCPLAFLTTAFGTTPATIPDISAASQDAPVITPSAWRLNGYLLEGRFRSNPVGLLPQLTFEQRSGEWDATGWLSGDVVRNALAELSSWWFGMGLTTMFNAHSLTTGKFAVQARRILGGAGAAGLLSLVTRMTTHSITFVVAGTVTIDGVAAANGKTIYIYAIDANNNVERMGSTTTTGGTGAFTFTTIDNTRTYFASYVDGVDLGRSIDGTPGTSTFDITIGEAPSANPGISFPAMANATTVDRIVDRMVDVIESIVPAVLPGDRFRRYRNEGAGDFLSWAEANADSCLRRFQVRFDGSEGLPVVTNCDVEERTAPIIVTIAYPQNARAGSKQALSRDRLVDRDHDQLELAIGILGRPNFSPPDPDAVCTGWSVSRPASGPVDFLRIEVSMRFYRQLSAMS